MPINANDLASPGAGGAKNAAWERVKRSLDEMVHDHRSSALETHQQGSRLTTKACAKLEDRSPWGKNATYR